MKVRYLGTLLLAILTFYGCDDNTGTLGMGMLPDSDGMSSNTKVFNVTTNSLTADAVYAKTSTGYVGKFTDKEFGDYEASFLTELNCTDNFSFPEVYRVTERDSQGNPTKATGTMTADSVVSAQLVVYYSKWFGDSLNACRMSVYELTKKLEKKTAYYTNIDPKEYYQNSPLHLFKAYTAFDTTVPDSVRYDKDANGNYTYYPNIVFPLDKKKFGEERILNVYRKHPEYFKDAATFIDKVFKGVYVKTDYGDGTVLYIDRVDLQMQFRFHAVNDTTGLKLKKKDGSGDSLFYSMNTVFASTKEVIQANQFKNSEKVAEKANEGGHTYIKSPAGIFTEAKMPYDDIYKELSKDTLNAVKLTFTNYNEENNYKFSMSAPKNVLLIRKKDLKAFFEENKLTDNVTSFTVTHNNVATNQYTFKNIARLVTTCINEKQAAKKKAKEAAGASWNEDNWEKNVWNVENADWDKVLLIPIAVTYDYSNSQNPTMTGIENDLQPGYAKLRGGKPDKDGNQETLKLEVTYTRFNN